MEAFWRQGKEDSNSIVISSGIRTRIMDIIDKRLRPLNPNCVELMSQKNYFSTYTYTYTSDWVQAWSLWLWPKISSIKIRWFFFSVEFERAKDAEASVTKMDGKKLCGHRLRVEMSCDGNPQGTRNFKCMCYLCKRHRKDQSKSAVDQAESGWGLFFESQS